MENHSSDSKLFVYIEEDIFDLVHRFLEAKKKEVVIVELSLAKKDFSAVTLFAHQIKGVGKMYGFAEITDIGHLLEEASAAMKFEESCKHLRDLKEFLDAVKIAKKVAA